MNRAAVAVLAFATAPVLSTTTVSAVHPYPDKGSDGKAYDGNQGSYGWLTGHAIHNASHSVSCRREAEDAPHTPRADANNLL
jgi:hypothetical protein